MNIEDYTRVGKLVGERAQLIKVADMLCTPDRLTIYLQMNTHGAKASGGVCALEPADDVKTTLFSLLISERHKIDAELKTLGVVLP